MRNSRAILYTGVVGIISLGVGLLVGKVGEAEAYDKMIKSECKALALEEEVENLNESLETANSELAEYYDY